MKIILKYYWPAVLWALFIFMMCTIKLGKIANASIFFPGFDKLVHCGFFFVLVVFVCNGLIRQQSPRDLPYTTIILVTVIAIIYGGIIELLQQYIFTWRDGEWDDLFADAVGASMGAFGVILTIYSLRYVKK